MLTGTKVRILSLQTVADIPVIAGLGFIVTTTVKSEPTQLPDVGLTV
jgi:hypothetical protein